MRNSRQVGLSERGARVGQYHHNAVLTDADVEMIRAEHEEGLLGYRALAKRYDVSNSTIRDIVKFRRRATFVARFKLVSA